MCSYVILIVLNLVFLASTFGVPLTVIDGFFDRPKIFGKNEWKSEFNFIFDDEKDADYEMKIIEDSGLNYRPIIGVLSQELTTQMNNDFGYLNYTSYIAASYVKFVEAAGARVVPVLISQSDEYYEHLGKSLNGFLFPGGGLYFDSEFTKAAKKIYEIVTRNNTKKDEPLALWATCLGFENLLYFVAGLNPQIRCDAQNVASTLIYQDGYEDSKLFKNVSQKILQDMATKNITGNFHHNCILPEKFISLGLNKSYTILSTSKDLKGVEYISTIEHRELPIFGTQWHPEKPMYEWTDQPNHNNIPHSIEAVQAAQALAQVFVQYARVNLNRFDSKEEESEMLIYNFPPTYIGHKDYVFELCYFF